MTLLLTNHDTLLN